jgi:hypothetical protein
MIKKTLLERSIFQDKIPEISFIDNKIISNSILNDFLSIKENKFKDIKIFSTQHIIWVCDYIRDHVLLNYGFNFVRFVIQWESFEKRYVIYWHILTLFCKPHP